MPEYVHVRQVIIDPDHRPIPDFRSFMRPRVYGSISDVRKAAARTRGGGFIFQRTASEPSWKLIGSVSPIGGTMAYSEFIKVIPYTGYTRFGPGREID